MNLHPAPKRHDLVDHIAYLPAISLLGNSLKTAIDHQVYCLILVKLRPDSFLDKIILYYIVLYCIVLCCVVSYRIVSYYQLITVNRQLILI